ncbi:hypothetical protein Droror1_Dr00017182 [Drosera rotundifolia]
MLPWTTTGEVFEGPLAAPCAVVELFGTVLRSRSWMCSSWLIGVGAQPCSRVWESACGVQLGSPNSSFTDQFVELSCEISALLVEVA